MIAPAAERFPCGSKLVEGAWFAVRICCHDSQYTEIRLTSCVYPEKNYFADYAVCVSNVYQDFGIPCWKNVHANIVNLHGKNAFIANCFIQLKLDEIIHGKLFHPWQTSMVNRFYLKTTDHIWQHFGMFTKQQTSSWTFRKRQTVT